MGDELHMFEMGSSTPGYTDSPCDRETSFLSYEKMKKKELF